jgi:hypothetical protein
VQKKKIKTEPVLFDREPCHKPSRKHMTNGASSFKEGVRFAVGFFRHIPLPVYIWTPAVIEEEKNNE